MKTRSRLFVRWYYSFQVVSFSHAMFESYQGGTDIYYLAGLTHGDQQLAKLENS